MTPDLVASLHPPRLPEAFTQLGRDDLLAAFGIGLLLAALILTIFAPLLRQRIRPPRLPARIAATADLPPQERMLALSRLLHERGGTLPDELRQAIYAGEAADPAQIEALIRNAGRRRGAR